MTPLYAKWKIIPEPCQIYFEVNIVFPKTPLVGSLNSDSEVF
jgi:hypothetical protein